MTIDTPIRVDAETPDAELLAAITPAAGDTRDILDPATGEIIGQAPVQGVDDLDRAVAAAKAAQPAWAALGHARRSELLLAAADAIDANAEALAHLDAQSPTRALVQMKLDDLGGGDAPAAPAQEKLGS